MSASTKAGVEQGARDERLAVLAHELRNPLAALQCAAEVLARHPTRDAGLERVSEIVVRQTRIMSSLVEELLDASRLDAERLVMRTCRLDLRELARTAVEDQREQIQRSGLRCETSCPAQAVWVVGDPVKLGQALGNLLSNSLKFTPAPGSIRVSVETSGRYALLAVEDSGVGIEPELLSVVFDRYRQASRGGFGGLGLGLPIAKGIVELHGGAITAASAGGGKGSTMTIRLPLESSEATST